MRLRHHRRLHPDTRGITGKMHMVRQSRADPMARLQVMGIKDRAMVGKGSHRQAGLLSSVAMVQWLVREAMRQTVMDPVVMVP